MLVVASPSTPARRHPARATTAYGPPPPMITEGSCHFAYGTEAEHTTMAKIADARGGMTSELLTVKSRGGGMGVLERKPKVSTLSPISGGGDCATA